MKDEYPTDEELKVIMDWDCASYEGSVALAEFICNLWHWEDWATLEGKRVKTLRLATGGWSGNESIMSALYTNFLFKRHWVRSERGGLTIYKIKPYKK